MLEVQEKESGVRQAMHTVGLLRSSFWSSWAVFEGCLAFISSLLLVAAGIAFQFRLFLDNSFALVFGLIFLSNLALTAFGFAVTTLLR